MKIEDWMVFSEELGKQINFMLSLGIVSTVLYLVSTNFLPLSWVRTVLRAVFFFEAALYYGFSLQLFKKWVEKTYG